MNRRSFFGWLSGVAAFPVDWVRGLLAEKVDLGWVTWPDVGNHLFEDFTAPMGHIGTATDNQMCGLYQCSARINWISDKDAILDWVEMIGPKDAGPFPRLVADFDTKTVSFVQDTSDAG